MSLATSRCPSGSPGHQQQRGAALIAQGGVRLDGEPCSDPDYRWDGRPLLIQVGKRKFAWVVPAEI